MLALAGVTATIFPVCCFHFPFRNMILFLMRSPSQDDDHCERKRFSIECDYNRVQTDSSAKALWKLFRGDNLMILFRCMCNASYCNLGVAVAFSDAYVFLGTAVVPLVPNKNLKLVFVTRECDMCNACRVCLKVPTLNLFRVTYNFVYSTYFRFVTLFVIRRCYQFYSIIANMSLKPPQMPLASVLCTY